MNGLATKKDLFLISGDLHLGVFHVLQHFKVALAV